MNWRTATIRTLYLLTLSGMWQGASAQPDRLASVDQLKVAFVYNFTRYFTWPGLDASNDFSVCVDDTAVAGGEFDTLTGQVTQERVIALRRTPGTASDIAEQCHVWYVAAADFNARRERLVELEDSPVLVVSDAPGSRNAGAVIELAVVNSRIQFRINTGLIASKGLGASAFLLRLAQ